MVINWLKRKRYLVPAECSECGERKSVVWYGRYENRPKGSWGFACLDHTEAALGDIAAGNTNAYALVAEQPGGGSVRVYQDLGCWLDPVALRNVLNEFDALDRAREVHARNPGTWGVRVHADGSLWLPWDPRRMGRC